MFHKFLIFFFHFTKMFEFMESGWIDAKVLTSFIAHFHKLTQKLCSDSTVNNLIMAMA